MPQSRIQKHSPSSELGSEDFAVTFNARTGRPLRKARRLQEDSPFVDSAVAVSDPAESDASENSTISVARRRKRRRSPSPPLSEETYDDDHVSDSGKFETQSAVSPLCQNAIQITFKDLVINVPTGHTGPLLLQLDISSQMPKQSSTIHTSRSSNTPYPQKSGLPPYQVEGKSTSRDSKYAGFLDIPAEVGILTNILPLRHSTQGRPHSQT